VKEKTLTLPRAHVALVGKIREIYFSEFDGLLDGFLMLNPSKSTSISSMHAKQDIHKTGSFA